MLVSRLVYSTLKMEAISSSETSGDFQQTTQYYIPEDSTLHNHHCENIKSYTLKMFENLWQSNFFVSLYPIFPHGKHPVAWKNFYRHPIQSQTCFHFNCVGVLLGNRDWWMKDFKHAHRVTTGPDFRRTVPKMHVKSCTPKLGWNVLQLSKQTFSP
jgi:hypothetical protein